MAFVAISIEMNVKVTYNPKAPFNLDYRTAWFCIVYSVNVNNI